ncbi:probable LRR receptor-like serine/threonine-protein kinase At1g56140 [Lolium rigidum]|uniref:probable LRR receptor-like serine/threonine-protein kinase At1g56140 n=1 Tax=Lolium rigidum TaxID=89674 RepID=UPI001F5DF488|nr:probable LRR receptor-like serine/threonine-protein kinase At1g56140 [Lolium rigidum]
MAPSPPAPLLLLLAWGLGYAATATTAEDPCLKKVWFGSLARNASINCSCDDLNLPCRITHLNVTGYWNLTDIPPALFNLTELVSLDLSNNNLSGQIPPEIANLSKLETWHFNNNQLSGPFPNGSSGLRSLQSLWMFDNYIEGTLPEFIANFTNLTDLRIYGMKLQGPIPNNFSNLINLEKLMLGDIDGGNSTFDFIANWANLSTLSLRKCGIVGQLPSIPRNLPNLTYLDLGSNKISGQIELLLPYKSSSYLYVGGNNLSGHLPSELVQSSRALDVSYNTFLNGSLPNSPAGQKGSINYIGTSIDASRTINSENLTLLNCLHMKGCNRTFYNNLITSCAINCGGKQTTYPDSLSSMFYDDTSDLGAAGFHVNSDRQWVVSHVGYDPLSVSPGIVNASQFILGADLPELYKTARTSRSDLWYYVVGLSNGKYTVQLFFAEIVIESELNRGPGRRSFNIDIQDQNIRTDFDITKEAGGFGRPTNITYEATVDSSVLKIHLYWNGRGTRAIPYEGAYGPLVSAIRVFRPEMPPNNSPPPVRPQPAPQDNKRRGVVAGIAALCIAGAVISSSVVYLWWKWVSLVKHPNT